MDALFLYSAKVVGISAIMFSYYLLFLKDKNFHQYNRFYLLATVLVSLLLPFLKINYFTVELKDAPYAFLNNFSQFTSPKPANHGFTAALVFAFILGVVSVILLARFAFGIVQIFSFKKIFPHKNQDGIRLYITDLEDAPFSFFRNLFWKKDILPASDLGRQILKHEMVHIEQKHSFDQVFIQTVSCMFWFNPAFYFIKKEISLIHEYLADKKSLKNSDTKAFAQMLLATHFSGKVIPGTSPLISSNLKKRLKMLQNPKTKFSYARRVFALPVIFTIVFVFIIKAKNKEIEKVNSATERLVSKIKSDTTGIGTNAVQTNAHAGFGNPQINQKYRDLNQIVTTAGAASPEYSEKIREIDILKKNQDTVSIVNDDFEYKKIGSAEVFRAKTEKGKAYENSLALQKIIADAKRPAEDGRERVLAEARRRAEDAAAYTSSPEFKKMMADAQRRSAEAQKYLKSDAYKKAMEEARRAAAYTSSPEFKKMMADAQRQSAEAQKYLKFDAYKKAMEEARKAAAYTSSPEFKKMMADAQRQSAEAQKYLKSDAYKKAMEEARRAAAYTSSPEFKKMLVDAQKSAADAAAYTSSPEFKKMMENAKIAAEEGKIAAAKAIAYTTSPEFKAAIAQAKAAGRTTKATATADADGDILIANGKNVYSANGKTLNTTGIDDDDFDKIRINGRAATINELHKLDRNRIKSTNIKAKNTDGKKYKSIDVTTK